MYVCILYGVLMYTNSYRVLCTPYVCEVFHNVFYCDNTSTKQSQSRDSPVADACPRHSPTPRLSQQNHLAG